MLINLNVDDATWLVASIVDTTAFRVCLLYHYTFKYRREMIMMMLCVSTFQSTLYGMILEEMVLYKQIHSPCKRGKNCIVFPFGIPIYISLFKAIK